MKTLLIFLSLVCAVCAQTFPTVNVTGRTKPVTNATIKSSNERGIVFKCDDGLVQVPFDKLPAEFAQYRKAAPATPAAPPKVAAPKAVKSAPKSEPSELNKAKEAKRIATVKANLAASIKRNEAIVNKYERQSSFAPGTKVSSEDYALAKAEIEEAKAKLREIE
jgi:hypothetical protein